MADNMMRYFCGLMGNPCHWFWRRRPRQDVEEMDRSWKLVYEVIDGPYTEPVPELGSVPSLIEEMRNGIGSLLVAIENGTVIVKDQNENELEEDEFESDIEKFEWTLELLDNTMKSYRRGSTTFENTNNERREESANEPVDEPNSYFGSISGQVENLRKIMSHVIEAFRSESVETNEGDDETMGEPIEEPTNDFGSLFAELGKVQEALGNFMKTHRNQSDILNDVNNEKREESTDEALNKPKGDEQNYFGRILVKLEWIHEGLGHFMEALRTGSVIFKDKNDERMESTNDSGRKLVDVETQTEGHGSKRVQKKKKRVKVMRKTNKYYLEKRHSI